MCPSSFEQKPLVVRFIGHTNDFEELDWAARFPGRSFSINGVNCVIGGRGDQDVLAVLGDARHDYVVRVRQGGVWVWHTEALMPKPYDASFDRIFTHVSRPEDPRFVTAPPVLDWWVRKSFDELSEMPVPEKTKSMSGIISTRTHLPGHHARNEFIALLEREVPEVDIYGRGRARPLEDKWDGLAPYRYSIVLENSSSNDYWTEKLSDAFMSFAVPLYFGAPNVGDYFPSDSYIWLPLDKPKEAIEVIRETLHSDDWESRLDALREARQRIFDRWCLAQQVSRAVLAVEEDLRTAPIVRVRVKGRRVWKNGWIRGAGLLGNLRFHGRWFLRKAIEVARALQHRGAGR